MKYKSVATVVALVLATAQAADPASSGATDPVGDDGRPPTDIEFDRLVAEFELRVEQGDRHKAIAVFANMRRGAPGSIPHELWFDHAEACYEAGLLEAALESANEYIQLAGREGDRYREALRLSVLIRDEVEQAERERRAEDRQRELERARWERLEAKARAQRQLAGDLPRDPMTDGGVAPLMVRLPAGRFCSVRGEDGPCHMTDVPPFAISKHVVTVEQFRRFVRATRYRTTSENRRRGCYESDGVWRPSDEGYERSQREFYRRTWKSVSKSQTDRHPVVCVSFADANRYVSWLSDQTGRRYQLPSQLQWQSAFLAGTTIGQLDEPLHPSRYGYWFRDSGHREPEFWRCNRWENRSVRPAKAAGLSCPPSPAGIRFESEFLEWNADEGYDYSLVRQSPGRTRVNLGFRVVRAL